MKPVALALLLVAVAACGIGGLVPAGSDYAGARRQQAFDERVAKERGTDDWPCPPACRDGFACVARDATHGECRPTCATDGDCAAPATCVRLDDDTRACVELTSMGPRPRR